MGLRGLLRPAQGTDARHPARPFHGADRGLIAIAAAVAIRGAGPAGSAVLWAIPAALSGTLGLFAFYRGMAVGAMSIVAPIAGVSAVVPVTFGLATGDRPSPAQIVGIIVRSSASARLARAPGGQRRVAAGAGLALLAALGFGGYFVPMHAAGEADFWWASLIFRTTSFTLVALTALALRSSVRISRRNTAYVSAVGLGDMLGNAAVRGVLGLWARQRHFGARVALSDRYRRARTILLGERVDRWQNVGIAATLAGVVLISAG